jgi:hypothetical protein
MPRLNLGTYDKKAKNRSSRFLVRKAYKAAYAAMATKISQSGASTSVRHYVVVGTPGVGKSTYLEYIVQMWASRVNGPTHVMWFVNNQDGYGKLYNLKNGALEKENIWYKDVCEIVKTWGTYMGVLTDGFAPRIVNEDAYVAKKLVIVSAVSTKVTVNASDFAEYTDSFVMPCWGLDELHACRCVLGESFAFNNHEMTITVGYTTDDNYAVKRRVHSKAKCTLEKRYEFVGGRPRGCLDDDNHWPNSLNLVSSSFQKLVSQGKASEDVVVMRHNLLRIGSDSVYWSNASRTCSLVSKHARILLTRHMQDYYQRLKTIFGGNVLFGDKDGGIYQTFIDGLLSRSEKNIHKDERDTRQNLQVVELKSSPYAPSGLEYKLPYTTGEGGVEYFDSLDDITIEDGKYYASTKKNFFTIDGFLVAHGYILLVQTTIAGKHQINCEGLATVLARIADFENLHRKEIRFLFVVPHERCIQNRQPLSDYGSVQDIHKQRLLELYVGSAKGEKLRQWRVVVKRLEFVTNSTKARIE